MSMQSIFMKKEAVVSCQIELNSSSLNDLMKESCGFMGPRTASEKSEFDEVLQYIEALQVRPLILLLLFFNSLIAY